MSDFICTKLSPTGLHQGTAKTHEKEKITITQIWKSVSFRFRLQFALFHFLSVLTSEKRNTHARTGNFKIAEVWLLKRKQSEDWNQLAAKFYQLLFYKE